MLNLLGVLIDLYSLGRSPDYQKPSFISKVATWLLIAGLLFLSFMAKHHPISLLHFGLGFLAALLLGFGVAYGLFRANITGSYRPGAFVLFVTTMAVWFMDGALWFVG